MILVQMLISSIWDFFQIRIEVRLTAYSMVSFEKLLASHRIFSLIIIYFSRVVGDRWPIKCYFYIHFTITSKPFYGVFYFLSQKAEIWAANCFLFFIIFPSTLLQKFLKSLSTEISLVMISLSTNFPSNTFHTIASNLLWWSFQEDSLMK